MTVTLNSAGGASVPNWQLVASASPTGVKTQTFSSLTGYSKYRILIPNMIISAGIDFLYLQFNGDVGANYSWQNFGYAGGGVTSGSNASQTYLNLFTGLMNNTTASSFTIDIENALIAAPKYVTGVGQQPSNAVTQSSAGWYNSTSAITSITLGVITNNFSSGTIYLLGAN